jgi:hypothetical protein
MLYFCDVGHFFEVDPLRNVTTKSHKLLSAPQEIS